MTEKADIMKDYGSKNEKMFSIILAFIIGVAFDYLFYKKQPGISYPIFNTLLLVFFMYCARERIRYKSITGWFVLNVILLLSINVSVHSNNFITAMNILGIPFLIVSYTLIVTDEKLDWSRISFIIEMLDRIFYRALSNIFKPFVFVKACIKKKEVEQKDNTKRSILIGLAVSFTLLLVVIPLLSSADMAFNHYIRSVSDVLNFQTISDAPVHIILVTVVFLYVFGYAWSFKYIYDKQIAEYKERDGLLDPVIILTVLIVVNTVYLLFTIIQFSYLYARGALPEGFTYAEYARRGFFELVAVTMINFIILLSSIKLIKKGSSRISLIVNIFLSVLVIFTFNMLFSAHYRLSLYEESYGFTELRIFVHMFMLFMSILFVIALIRIWFEKLPLFKASAICALLMYVALNYMNVDKIVARNNIERYLRTGKIDAGYLTILSYDAIPEILKLVNDKNMDVAQEIRDGLEAKNRLLDRDYKWMEYNYSRNKAKKLLKAY